MNNKQTEKQIGQSFSNVTPDVYNDISARCPTRAAVKRQRSANWGWKLSTCALALVLVVAIVFGGVMLGTQGRQSAVAATVTLDVNPSVAIELSTDQVVLGVKALNKDGERILGDLDLTGSNLQTAVYAIVGSMTLGGYFSVDNSVLVSVDADQSLYQSLVDKVTSEITVILGSQNVQASVLSQWITQSESAKSIAQQYGISSGKAQLIAAILDASQNAYTAEQLAKLNVNELNLIIESLNLPQDVLSHNGNNASQSRYIGREEAINKALEAVAADLTLSSLSQTDVSRLQCKMDNDDGVMVYEVELVYNDWEYDVDINAITGAVVKLEKELQNYRPYDDATRTKLSEEDIRNLVRSMFDLPQNQWVQVSYDRDDGVYEVKVNPNQGKFYEIEFNVYGDVISFSEEEIEIMPGPVEDQWQGGAPGDQYSAVMNYVITQLENIYKQPIDRSKMIDFTYKLDDDYRSRNVWEVEFKYQVGNIMYEYECSVDIDTMEIIEQSRDIDD